MLNLLKWNSLDFLHRYSWMLIVAAASLVLAVLIPDAGGLTNALLVFSACTLAAVFFPACSGAAMYQCFGWLRHDSAMLELALPVSAWKHMLSRFTIALVVNALSSLGLMGLMIVFGKYSSGSIGSMTLEHWKSVGYLTFILLLIDMTVLFAYMLTRGMGLTRLWAALFTTLFSTILLTLIAVFLVYVMIWANVIVLPHFASVRGYIDVQGNLNISSFIPAFVGGLWVILLEYLGSSLLLKYSLQVN